MYFDANFASPRVLERGRGEAEKGDMLLDWRQGGVLNVGRGGLPVQVKDPLGSATRRFK